MAYLRPAARTAPLKPIGAVPEPADPQVTGIDRTAKLFIGGKQARPDGGHSRAVWSPRGHLLGHIGLANRKDVRNAVEAAQGAKGWGRTTAHARAQILYYIAENLSSRAPEFANRIQEMTGKPGTAEVEAAIQRLFTYAAWADKYEGAAKPVPMRGLALALNEPVGVIAGLCPDQAPLLGLISLMAPAIAMGNTVVLAASDPFPLAATDFYQVLETSDLPAGVVNILTGSHKDLAKPLAGHMDIDAIWSFSTVPAALIEAESASNLKRTWVANGQARDWATAEGREFLSRATEVKTVWVPYGE